MYSSFAWRGTKIYLETQAEKKGFNVCVVVQSPDDSTTLLMLPEAVFSAVGWMIPSVTGLEIPWFVLMV